MALSNPFIFIGAMSTAAMLGYSLEEIRKVGRWSSHRYKLYACNMPQLKDAAWQFIFYFRCRVTQSAVEDLGAES